MARFLIVEAKPTRVVHAMFPNGTLGAMRVIDGDCTIQELVHTKEFYPEMTVACLGTVDLTSEDAAPGMLGFCTNGTRRAVQRREARDTELETGHACSNAPSITG